jgi:hypothetical protein
METIDIDDTYGKMTAKLFELGGTIFTEQSQKTDFSAYSSATFKLPPENLDAFLAYVDECGKVTHKSISSEDVTAQYIDTEIRLENKRRNLEKYYEYLDNAHDAGDVIAIQQQIDQITADIESYQGMLNYWSRSVKESQVDIEIRQLQDPNEIDIDDVEFSTLSLENMGKLMSNGIKKCADVIITLFQWLLIIIVTILPLLILAALVVAIVIIRRKVLDKKNPERIEARRKAKERYKYNPAVTSAPATASREADTDNPDANKTGYKKPPQ